MIKNKQTLSVWKVKAENFPSRGSVERQIKYLLRYAILAPSGHNSQPWKFKIENKTLKIYADLSQARREVDPENRELYISVGCAITNIEVAAKYFKMDWEENWWPDSQRKDLVAELKFGENRKLYPGISPLFEAIPKRSTYREAFEPGKEIGRQTAAKAERWFPTKAVKTRWVYDMNEKEKVGALVASAQKIWFRSKKLTEELEFWLKLDIAQMNKKVSSGVVMLNNFSKRLNEFLGSEFADVDLRAERDKQWLVESPAVGVMFSKNDNEKEWVETGRKYQYLALWATSNNMQIGFFNSVAELPKKRAQLAITLGEKRWPQLVFRIGYGKRSEPSPRKTVESVLISTH